MISEYSYYCMACQTRHGMAKTDNTHITKCGICGQAAECYQMDGKLAIGVTGDDDDGGDDYDDLMPFDQRAIEACRLMATYVQIKDYEDVEWSDTLKERINWLLGKC